MTIRGSDSRAVLGDADTDFEGSPLSPLVRCTGQDFFEELVAFVRRALAADLVFVGELFGEDWEMVRAIVVSSDLVPEKPFEYCLVGTPGDVVVSRGILVAAREVRRRFPDSSLLKHIGAEAYAGIRLRDASHRPLGLLVVLSRKPWKDVERVQRLLEILQDRASAELGHRRTLAEMRTLLESTTMPSSEDVFRTLARQVARAMHVGNAILFEYVDRERGKSRIVTAWIGGRIREDLEHQEVNLTGTPSEASQSDSAIFQADSPDSTAGNIFKDIAGLETLRASSYIGTLINDSAGKPIGHLALVHDQPLRGRRIPQHLLRVFATRVGAELSRVRAERDRLTVERKLLETQKMESLGVLAGGIAHDFNNILVGILGNASLALIESKDDSVIKPYLTEIESSALRAADLARQMLAYSGKGRFVIGDVDLNELVREMVNLLQVSVTKRVVLRFNLESSLPAVRVDATQIRQVVMNLVMNGAEAVEGRSGAVTVSTGMVRLNAAAIAELAHGRELDPGDYVFVGVVDTGTGMDEETIAKIFDPFFTTKFTGRGLGLAAVQGIVRGHGAGLSVESVMGTGTTIRLLLPPASETALLETIAAAGDPKWRGSGRVLVVDDEETVQVAMARIVERIGFEVSLASDGREGVALFERNRDAFDLILLDLTMPHLSGEEALRELRKIKSDIPVILMSGYSEEEMHQRFDGLGIAGFLQKPFTLADVSLCIQGALGVT